MSDKSNENEFIAGLPRNMVNFFSFGCHVIDRAYVLVFRLYEWGRGEYQKEERGVSGVSWQVRIFYIGHSQLLAFT